MSSNRYPKRRRVSARNKEPTPPEAETQTGNSSPDELAPSTDRAKNHPQKRNSQPKRGGKGRKRSQPDPAEEADTSHSAKQSTAADASDDELNTTAAVTSEVPSDKATHIATSVVIQTRQNGFQTTEEPSNTTLYQGVKDHAPVASSPEQVDQEVPDATNVTDVNGSLENINESAGGLLGALPEIINDTGDNPRGSRPQDAADYEPSPSADIDPVDMLDTVMDDAEEKDYTTLQIEPDEAQHALQEEQTEVTRVSSEILVPPLPKPESLNPTPTDTAMPTFFRRGSTFKKAERQPHDRSTSRSPPPMSPISTPAATPAGTPVATPAATSLAAPLPNPAGIPRYIPFKQKCILEGHRRGVAQVRFSPNGRLIASCSADATVRIWETSIGRCLHTLEGHLAGISALAWSPDSRTLASGSDDKSIRLWDVATGRSHPHALQQHSSYVYALAFSPRGNMLASGSYDEALFLWDVRTARLMRSLPAHSDPIGGVDFVRDGTLIVSCAGDGLIRVWDTATGQCLRTLVHEDNAAVVGVRFSPNGKFILAWTLDSSIRLWNYIDAKGRCVKTYQGHENVKYSIGGAFGTYENEDGSMEKAVVASGDEDGRIFVWDVVSKKVLQQLEGHEGVVFGVDTWSQGGLMVSCGADKTVRIWEREEGEGYEDEEAAQVTEEVVDGEVVDHEMSDGVIGEANGVDHVGDHDLGVVNEQADVTMVDGAVT